MAKIDEFVLKNIGFWWRYGISRHYDEWKYIIIGRIFKSEIILIPPSLKISESSSNGSYRNTDEVWWRYRISRSCDECGTAITNRLQNSFKIKDNNLYRSSYYWNFRTSSFKQVACLILQFKYMMFTNFWVSLGGNSTRGLLVRGGIIRPVICVSTLTWFITYIHYWNWQVPK
jgi:hypothetical protein